MNLEEIQRYINEKTEEISRIPKSFFGDALAATSTTSRTTIDDIKANMKMTEPILKQMQRNYADSFRFGMSVQTSHWAETITPNKVHKHRRGQTKAYHARIQKKWTKRFGVKHSPCAYVINDVPLGLYSRGPILVVHPTIAQKLKEVAV